MALFRKNSPIPTSPSPADPVSHKEWMRLRLDDYPRSFKFQWFHHCEGYNTVMSLLTKGAQTFHPPPPHMGTPQSVNSIG